MPQGIGVVEGTMALTYSSLGVPVETATVIAIAFRGLTFWLPMVVGCIVIRRLRSFKVENTSDAFPAQVTAGLALLAGIVNLISGVTPSQHSRLLRLAKFVPMPAIHGARIASVLAGFGLLLLAGNLWRRKRIAWIAALTLLILSAVSHLAKGFDYEESIIMIASATWLLVQRKHFYARSDRPSVLHGLKILGYSATFVLAYGTLGFYLLDRHFSVQFGLSAAIKQTIVMFVEFCDPGLHPITGFGRYFADSIYLVGACTLVYSALMISKSMLMRKPPTIEDRERAATAVKTWGHSSLAALTLLDDKWYYFSEHGSVVAYTVKGGVAVALGDPIGPPEDALSAIIGFTVFCSRNGWIPSFFQTLLDYLEHYSTAGYRSLCIGHEAIVDLAEFTLEGRRMKPVRESVNRLRRLGYTAQLHEPPLSDELIDKLRSVSNAWLNTTRGSEKGFSLGWFDDDYVRACRVMAIHRPDNGITAFANIIPEYQVNEATIDMMRYHPSAINGTMDFLFVELFEWSKSAGYDTFNMGLSPLAGVGDKTGDAIIERAVHYIYEHMNRFYSFKGLHAFKAKFQPKWSPRYLLYPSPINLFAIVLAVIRANTGEDFPWSYIRR